MKLNYFNELKNNPELIVPMIGLIGMISLGIYVFVCHIILI